MKVHFGQIYIEPGITFPFSHHFQICLSKEITSLITPSQTFQERYGTDWELTFNISAKAGIDDNHIKGPSVYRADKDVEYTVFLPYDVIAQSEDRSRSALRFLISGCGEVLRQLEIDPTAVEDAADGLIEAICSDPKMFAE